MGLILIVAAAAAAAHPAASSESHDLQCMVLAGKIAASDDEQARTNGLMASMYYAGKIFGSHPSIDLKAALEAEVDRMAKVDIAALAKACGGEMQARGAQMQAAGQALVAEGK
jgi:hypothetical protein